MIRSEEGLDDAKAEESRRLYGRNVLPSDTRTGFSIIIGIVTEPMFILLGIACALYFITGQIKEGVAMTFAMALVAGISVYQEARSEKALEALRSLVRPGANVLRSGKWIVLPMEDVVVGDLVRLIEGEQVPADGEFVSGNDLTVNEAVLTGESFPVSKSNSGDRFFTGTVIVTGTAVMRVSAVGLETELGRLGKSITRIQVSHTPLQKQIGRFTRWMAIIGITAFAFVWLVNYLESGDLLHGLFHGLTLAMAVLPEEIPVAVSTFMALGAYRMIKKRVLVRHLHTVEALGAATVICVDKTGTITQNSMSLVELWITDGPDKGEQSDLLLIARLACEPHTFDPMEKAIEEKFRTTDGSSIGSFKLISEYPLGGEYPMMTHVYESLDGRKLLASKGSPEGVLRQCSITTERFNRIEKEIGVLAKRGFRVLAVASASVDSNAELPSDQSLLRLEFKGLLAFADPVKSNIPDVIKSFRQAGIRIKMITGDHPSTACHVAAIAGLERPNDFLTGEQIHSMSPEQLSEAVERVDVFARSMPETKLKIIRALKARGEVVAMTGDGVNDAPALKAADIGISMGKRGSEVARQASSLVLLDDDLSAMVDAVSHGRRIYSNLKKSIGYIIGIHIPLISVVLVPLLLGWDYASIFSPIHVIFLEMVMGPTCSIIFEGEPADPDAMRRSPRPIRAGFFNLHELSSAIIRGMVVAIFILTVMGYAEHLHWSEGTVRTAVFVMLTCSNIFLTFAARSDRFSAWSTISWRNPLLWYMHIVTSGLLVLALNWTPMMRMFDFSRIPWFTLMCLIGLSFLSVFWQEPFKRVKTR